MPDREYEEWKKKRKLYERTLKDGSDSECEEWKKKVMILGPKTKISY